MIPDYGDPAQAFDPLSDPAIHPPGQRSRARAVRPRRAATLVLIDQSRSEPALLMGRRHARHRFMPGKWVFPGGRTDRADSQAVRKLIGTPADLAPAALQVLAPVAPPLTQRALALAALRETWEETGYRLPIDLSPLRVLGRAITPPWQALRFDTLFFFVEADPKLTLTEPAMPQTDELEAVDWMPIESALSLDLPAITRFMILELGQRLKDPSRPAPEVRVQRGQRRIVPILSEQPRYGR
ncbi:MAG: NUDIX hydrolase [Asticcacaulis sp.]